MIREAGADPAARERFAADYRRPVLDFVRAHGIAAQDAEDLCHEVFVRLLRGEVLAKADAARGTLRSLLKTVARRTIIDWRRRQPPRHGPPVDVAGPEPDFDHHWQLHLTARAMEHLAAEKPQHYETLRAHLAGDPQPRQRLWLARTHLKTLLRCEEAKGFGDHRP
jgi:RNA polymerase sigma factor (sigma-70 family)